MIDSNTYEQTPQNAVFQGRLLTRTDSDYDSERKVWNAMIDRRPAVIAKCASIEDIETALHFARSRGLEIAVRGGGHNIAGHALSDGGLVIDLSGLRAVEVDSVARQARVQPGATLADFDAACQQHGLATPVGVNSTTGIAGLTLGGGFGWLSRQYGMTVDNLLSAELVTVDGRRLTASAEENAELFWGLRGGSGNFGIVTQFEFALHPVGPEILAGLVVYPLAQGVQVLRGYRQFTASAPESTTVFMVVRKAPPLPFLPVEVHGTDVVVLAIACTAPEADQSEIAPLLCLGDRLGSHIGKQPYVQWQQAFDPLLTPGARNYWKTHNFTDLHDAVIDHVVSFGALLPTAECEFFISHLAGAPNRVPPDATAYCQRDARFVMNIHGRWQNPDQDESIVNWARTAFEACAPLASSGAYVNFMTEDEQGRIEHAYGINHHKLQRIKHQYDPDNLLHLNPNITPRVAMQDSLASPDEKPGQIATA